jgi:hypothetical protein
MLDYIPFQHRTPRPGSVASVADATDATDAYHWRAFKYVRKQYRGSELRREDCVTVYCLSRADFGRLLERWNRRGAFPSGVDALSYTYIAV